MLHVKELNIGPVNLVPLAKGLRRASIVWLDGHTLKLSSKYLCLSHWFVLLSVKHSCHSLVTSPAAFSVQLNVSASFDLCSTSYAFPAVAVQ